MTGNMTDSPGDRLARLSSYLDADPDNAGLLAEAAEVAIQAGAFDRADDLIARLAAVQGGGFGSAYLTGMLALHRRDFAAAADLFATLMQAQDTPALRFNRAWALAMTGDKQGASDLLDDATQRALPAAATLKLQLVHEAGDFDGALDLAKALLPLHGDDPALRAAVSVLALDVEDIDLARDCARRGGDHPDALATRGALALDDADPQAAMASFDRALAIRQHHPRAWIGRGLAQLALHDAGNAASDLDRGAEQFGDHLGSWIAAGWAHFVAGQLDVSRARFERALALDDSFAESHGSLAVLDVLAGDRQAASRRVAVALRLDRQCFAAALAQALLSADRPEQARAIIETALATPLNASGQTIAAYMARMPAPTLH